MSVVPLLKSNRLLNVEGAVEALGGAEVLYEKVLNQAVGLIPSRIESLDSFIAAENGLHDFGVLAHGRKGSMRQIGCHALGTAAESLEKAAKDGDRHYCQEHYEAFREDLTRFHREITDIFSSARSSEISSGNICDYYEALLSAREFAQNYDCISAGEFVSKLAGVSFGEEIDALVTDAIGALDIFQTEQALISINKLVTICETAGGAKQSMVIEGEAPAKILVVDDDEANLTVIDGILSGYYKVYSVTSGAIALKFLEKQSPDLILLDVEMPEMSGVDLFNIIKTGQKLPDVPVVFLTGNTDAESEAEAFRLGISDYIRKPVNEVIMLARVKMQLELAVLRRNAAKTE